MSFTWISTGFCCCCCAFSVRWSSVPGCILKKDAFKMTSDQKFGHRASNSSGEIFAFPLSCNYGLCRGFNIFFTQPHIRRIKVWLYRDALLTFKCMNGMAPTNLSSKFIKRGTISSRSTRNADQLKYPAV